MAYYSSGVLSPEQISPFAAFVTGMQTGAEKMIDISKKAEELKRQIHQEELDRQAQQAAADEAARKQGLMPGSKVWTGEGVDRKYYVQPGTDTAGGATTAAANFPSGQAGGAGGGGGTPSATAAANTQAIAKVLKDEYGWSDAAIQGAVANGLAESGMGENTQPGKAGELGIWQFNPKGELPGYQAAYGSDWSAQSQARYIGGWVDQHMPQYKNIQDPQAATDQFMSGFERPKVATPGSRYSFLPQAGMAMGTLPTPAFTQAVPQVPSYAGALAPGAPAGVTTAAALPQVPGATAAMGAPMGGAPMGAAPAAVQPQAAALTPSATPVSPLTRKLYGAGQTYEGKTGLEGLPGQQSALAPVAPTMSYPQYAYQMGQPQAPPPPSTMQQLAQTGGPLNDYMTFAQLNQQPMALTPARSALFT